MGIIPTNTGVVPTRILHTGRICPESTRLSFLLSVRYRDWIRVARAACHRALRTSSLGISWRTMSQMNPTNSRAMATHATLVFFPARVRVL
jgi:hypothetical protein